MIEFGSTNKFIVAVFLIASAAILFWRGVGALTGL